MLVRTLAVAAVALCIAPSAHASTITIVPGTSNPWLAGMPNGSTATIGDTAPAQSPALVAHVIFDGEVLLFTSITGVTDHCPGFGCLAAGPEGDAVEGVFGHAIGAENGIGDVIVPIDSLIGVFLGPDQPDLTPAPAALNFLTPASRDFSVLAPALKQPFFIGNGLRNDGLTLQAFIAPTGATRLYLGTMDGYEWNNNSGGFEVTVSAVPEPATLLLLGSGLVGVARRRRKN